MELIDAYVSEVGRRLPEKSRADIEREIPLAKHECGDERRAHATQGTRFFGCFKDLQIGFFNF